jgi:hypothetical protein
MLNLLLRTTVNAGVALLAGIAFASSMGEAALARVSERWDVDE